MTPTVSPPEALKDPTPLADQRDLIPAAKARTARGAFAPGIPRARVGDLGRSDHQAVRTPSRKGSMASRRLVGWSLPHVPVPCPSLSPGPAGRALVTGDGHLERHALCTQLGVQQWCFQCRLGKSVPPGGLRGERSERQET